MADPIDATYCPAAADELFGFQPPDGDFLEVFDEPTMLAFITMTLVGFALCLHRTILIGISPTVWNIAGKLTGDSRFVNTDYFSDFSL